MGKAKDLLKRIYTKDATQIDQSDKSMTRMNSSNLLNNKSQKRNSACSQNFVSIQSPRNLESSQSAVNISLKCKNASFFSSMTSNRQDFKPCRRKAGFFEKFRYVTESHDASSLNENTNRTMTESGEKSLLTKNSDRTLDRKGNTKLSNKGEFFTGWKNSLHKYNVFTDRNLYFNEVDFTKADHSNFFKKKQVQAGAFNNKRK